MTRRITFTSLARDFGYAVIPPAALLTVHMVRQTVLPYSIQFDVVAHFLGGASIAWMTLILWQRWTAQGLIPASNPTWLRDFTVWGAVALAGIFWEFMEWFGDAYFNTLMQPSLTDTMNDFFMDLSGGLLFILIASVVFRKKA